MPGRTLNVGLLCPILILSGYIAASTQPRMLAVSHVNVVDVETGSIRRDMTVTLTRGRISAVESSGRRPPAGAQIVDGTGKYLIPGLWDMHVHWYDERFLPLFLANGVTGVRQMFGGLHAVAWRQRVENGDLFGPRHVVASPIVDGPQPVWPGSLVVADAKEAREAVQWTKRTGYDFVKVYNRLPREAYFAILDEAKREGLTVEGHVPNAIAITEASDGGQKVIEHLTGVLVGASREEAELRRVAATLLQPSETGFVVDAAMRSNLRAQRERALATYDASKAAALFARFRTNGTWHCPTLTVLRSGASLDLPAFTNDPRLKYMSPAIRESWKPERSPRRSWKMKEDYELDRRTLRRQFEIVGAMQRAGVSMLAGTDVLNPFAFPGFSLHDELALLVEAGLTPIQALRAATVNPARYLGKTDSQGTVQPGKIADLVLLEGNPLDDITMTTRIAAVIFGGRLFDRTALDMMLSEAEKTANGASLR